MNAMACALFPRNNTQFGTDESPALSWTSPPAGTQSYALVLQDLSNMGAHWVMWNIPGTAMALPAALPSGAMPSMPSGARQASRGNGEAYWGPGACGNVYEFVLYALSVATIMPTGNVAEPAEVRTFVRGLGATILGSASIRARSGQPNCP